jgi:hypothetical protein
MSKQQVPPKKPQVGDVDFQKNFINYGRFPVYNYDNLIEVMDTTMMRVEKIPMYVDNVCVWTHFRVTLKPSWRTEPYKTDVDIRLTMFEGEAWILIQHKGKNAGDIVGAGSIMIIPANASYTILNISRNGNCVYTMDANTLLEMG